MSLQSAHTSALPAMRVPPGEFPLQEPRSAAVPLQVLHNPLRTPFCEGNTRTTAVFAIKYLKSIGFECNNDMFEQHSWYFRNALVRANYRNAVEGIDYAPEYLERFFRNLLLGEQWDLRNRYLHIHPTDEWRVQPNLAGDVGINPANVGINVGINAKESKLLELLINNNSTTAVEAASILHFLSDR